MSHMGVSRQELLALETISTVEIPSIMPMLRREAKYFASTQPSSRPVGEVIKALVLNSTQNDLLVDEAFIQLESVVTGKVSNMQVRYAEVLAEALTQPSFACAHPIYHNYFQARYGNPLLQTSCSDRLPFLVISSSHGAKVEWLDIERVREVQLIFASASDNLASRFGHVSLRLTVCPQNDFTPQACDHNLYEHYSLGFLAQVDELSLSLYSGLVGKYRAYLLARPFMDTYEEYAVNEFRDIYAAPIKLNEEQRERLLRGLADIHWQYEGEYRFFGNNCAGMLLQALRTLLPEYADDSGLNENFIRPDSFFASSRNGDWVNGSKLADLKQAERDGYFFSSTRPFYEKAFDLVRHARNLKDIDDIGKYIRVAPQDRRQQRNLDTVYLTRLKEDKQLREAEIMLEQYAMFASERALISEGSQILEKQGSLNIEEFEGQLDTVSRQYLESCFLAPLRAQFQPLPRSSGIPEKTRLPEKMELPSTCETAEGMSQLNAAFSQLVGKESNSWKKLQLISQYWTDTIHNIKELSQI